VAQGGLGLAFGRTGCLLAGCCHGRPVEAPLPSWLLNVVPLKWPEWFSLTFPSEAEGLGSLLDQPLVPTQPLSGLYSLAIFLFIALWLVPRKRYHGQVVVWFLMMYAVARATIELFRGDARGMYFGEALSTSQIVSVPVFLAGLAILLWARSRMASGKLSPLSATWREDALAAALKPAGVEPRKGGTVRKNKKKKRRR
jgi:phosphatidylglycerol:prolipoprotein diacylglycerol transferase